MFTTFKRNLTLLLATCVVSASIANVVKFGRSSDGLVFHLGSGLENLKIKDSSGKKNNGIAASIMVSNSPSLVSMQDTHQLTLAIWIKPNSVHYEFPVLISKGGYQTPNADGGYELTLNANGDNDIVFYSGSFYADTQGANGSLINNHLGEWIHIVVTVDTAAQTTQIYVNGQSYANVSIFGNYSDVNFNVPNDLYVGIPDPSANANRVRFDGTIGPVSIYNRALSADEVQKLFSSTTPKALLK